jgi:hypothetical protein
LELEVDDFVQCYSCDFVFALEMQVVNWYWPTSRSIISSVYSRPVVEVVVVATVTQLRQVSGGALHLSGVATAIRYQTGSMSSRYN